MAKATSARRSRIHRPEAVTAAGRPPPSKVISRLAPPVSKMAARCLSEMASPEGAGRPARFQNGGVSHRTSLSAGRSQRSHRLTAIGPSRAPSAAPLSWQRAESGGGRAEAARRGGDGAGPGGGGAPGVPGPPRRRAAGRPARWGAPGGRGAARRGRPGAGRPRCRPAGPGRAGGAGQGAARRGRERPGRPAAARHGGQLQGQDLAGGAEDQPAAAPLEGGERPPGALPLPPGPSLRSPHCSARGAGAPSAPLPRALPLAKRSPPLPARPNQPRAAAGTRGLVPAAEVISN